MYFTLSYRYIYVILPQHLKPASCVIIIIIIIIIPVHFNFLSVLYLVVADVRSILLSQICTLYRFARKIKKNPGA